MGNSLCCASNNPNDFIGGPMDHKNEDLIFNENSDLHLSRKAQHSKFLKLQKDRLKEKRSHTPTTRAGSSFLLCTGACIQKDDMTTLDPPYLNPGKDFNSSEGS